MGRKSKAQDEKKGKVSISISTSNFQIMEVEGVNKSQLINWLLEQYFKNLNQ